MTRSRKIRTFVHLLGMSSLLTACNEITVVSASGPSAQLSDAQGDTEKCSSDKPIALIDLSSGAARVVGGNLHLSIDFASAYAPQETATFLFFDTDQDGQHEEYSVLFWRGEVRASHRVRTDTSIVFQQIPNSISPHNRGDGFDVIIPLSILGNDDGLMSFQVYSSSGAGGGCGIDVMPNDNHATIR